MSVPYRTPSVDLAFLTYWSPARFAVTGMLAYAALFVVSPLEYDYSVISLGGCLYAAAVLLAFFGGCHMTTLFNMAAGPAAPRPIALLPDRLVNITALIGTVGVLARIYDRFILRGFAVSSTYMETRESITETVSVFGYIGGLAFSFGMIALVLMWLSSSQHRRPLMFAFVGVLALYPMVELLLQGSRSVILHTAFLIFMFARSTNSLRWLVRSRFLIVLACVAIVILAQLIYEVRSLQGDDELDIAEVFRLTAIGRFARPPDWIIDAIIATNGQGVIAIVLKNWTHLTQYLTHSWVAYFVSFDQFEDVIGWGRIHFIMPVRAFSALLGEDFGFDPGLFGMEVGVSSTAITLVYYDFGPAGPLFAALFGLLVTVIYRKTIWFPERWLPLHAYLCFACLMMMIDNILVGGLGMFAVASFAAYVPFHYLLSILAQEDAHQVAMMEASGERSHAGTARSQELA